MIGDSATGICTRKKVELLIHTRLQESVGEFVSVVLCGDLSASVVSVFLSNSTTETQRTTEFAQRNAFFPTDSFSRVIGTPVRSGNRFKRFPDLNWRTSPG